MLNMDALRTALESMQDKPIMIIGDIMLDHYVFGQVERISPEAPVPVLRVGREQHLLGGAGNVARNIAALGGVPVLFAVTGQDRESRQIRELCSDSGFELHSLEDSNRPTTRKTRVVAGAQQLVRVDRESTERVDDALTQALLRQVEERLDSISVIIISDYGKGLISKLFLDSLKDMLKGRDEKPLILVDPKTRNWDAYAGVDMLTPNTKEASEGSGISIQDHADVISAGQALIEKLQCHNLLVTLGEQGMAVFNSKDDVYHIPTVGKTVFDVTGAGDTVIATLALALSSGADLLTACSLANYAAGITVGQVGAATADAEEIALAMTSLPRPQVTRLS